MGFLRQILPIVEQAPDSFSWLGQIGQGLELDELQIEGRFEGTQILYQHSHSITWWLFMCIWRQGIFLLDFPILIEILVSILVSLDIQSFDQVS